jgi:ribonuclease P/MRP protein subunit POP5
MNTVPIKNGRSCIFQVVRVSGTIRKAEQEAIRNAREMILRARRELGEQSDEKLDSMLGKPEKNKPSNEDADVLMVDRSDSEEEEEELSDGDG